MTTRELIKELEKQKAMLGDSFFDVELLEKYLNLSTKENKPEKIHFEIHGIISPEQLANRLKRLYPYKNADQRFNRARAPWHVLFAIANKPDAPVNVDIAKTYTKDYQYKKTASFK